MVGPRTRWFQVFLQYDMMHTIAGIQNSSIPWSLVYHDKDYNSCVPIVLEYTNYTQVKCNQAHNYELWFQMWWTKQKYVGYVSEGDEAQTFE